MQGKPHGVVLGGLLQQIQRRVEIQCLPGAIPDHIALDVGNMEIGGTLHLSDLVMPEGVKTTAIADEAVVILVAPDTSVEETPAAEGEVGTGADGEGAPAADAAGRKLCLRADARREHRMSPEACDAILASRVGCPPVPVSRWIGGHLLFLTLFPSNTEQLCLLFAGVGLSYLPFLPNLITLFPALTFAAFAVCSFETCV